MIFSQLHHWELRRTHLKFYLLLPTIFCVGCVATSNFHSAQVLEEGKFAIAMGMDDIVLKSSDESITVTKKTELTPSLAVAYGFPYRIEGNLRYFPPDFAELTLRHQVNPPSFDIIDASINLHVGHAFGKYSYLKYGVTVSKDIYGFEPFVHYSGYRFLGANANDVSEGFLAGVTDDFINKNRVIGFGIGIPLRKAKLFPEVDYQYFGSTTNGVWHFGVGLRIPIE